MRKTPNMCKDFIAAHLRSQISDLQNVLFHIESSGKIEDEYINESLKKVERSMRQLIKLNAA